MRSFLIALGLATLSLTVVPHAQVAATQTAIPPELALDKTLPVDPAVRTGKLQVIAEAAVQRFSSLCQRVTELFSLHAGERHTVVDGTSHEQAKSAAIVTEEKMSINGKAIYLG